MQFITGQNKPLQGEQFEVSFNRVAPESSISAYAFLQDGNTAKSIVCKTNTSEKGIDYNEHQGTFSINLSAISDSVSKISFAVALENSTNNFGNVIPPEISVSGSDSVSYELSSKGRFEKSLIVLEVYRHNGTWKIKATAAGYKNGIEDLLKLFNISLPAPKPTRRITLGSSESQDSNEEQPVNKRNEDFLQKDSSSNHFSQQGIEKMFKKLFGQGEKSVQDLKSGILKFKSKNFLRASIAGSFMVAAADGSIDAEEKKKLLAFIQTDDALSVFDTSDVISIFKEFEDAYEFDADAGKAQALKAISKVSGNAEQSKFLIRLIIAIGSSDGDFDNDEKNAVREVCQELSVPASDFNL